MVTPLVRPVAVEVELGRLGTEAAVEQVLVAERGRVTDAVDLVAELHDLVLRSLTSGRCPTTPVLADWTIRSWMRWSIEWTGVSAPSAVCTTEMPSWAFCVRLLRPETCLSRFWLMTRPDASSAARLMR